MPDRPPTPAAALAKAALRSPLRRARKALAQAQGRQAARAVARQFRRWRLLRSARRVALYLPAGSELDTRPLIASLHARGVEVYLPRIARGQVLRFLRTYPHTRRPRHAHGMRQPAGGRALPLCRVQLVLLPLLAFDAAGNRLGQGGGYYDRALARLGRQRPWRIGLAFAQQAREALPVEPWDAPLHGVLSERGLLRFRRCASA